MTLLLISLGVAMDATAVSAGWAIRGARARDVLTLALTFGVFQFGMSLAGAFGGTAVERYFSTVDHWIAFVLLAVVGGKMVWEAFRHEDHPSGEKAPRLAVVTLLTLGIATSIDALAVGVTLPTLDLGVVTPAVAIGAVTAICSFGGAWIGKRLGERFGAGVETFGGIVLIGIGVKTLIEHLAG